MTVNKIDFKMILKYIAFFIELKLDDDMVANLLIFSSSLLLSTFLKSSICCGVALNDLNFYQQLFHYMTIHSVLADNKSQLWWGMAGTWCHI